MMVGRLRRLGDTVDERQRLGEVGELEGALDGGVLEQPVGMPVEEALQLVQVDEGHTVKLARPLLLLPGGDSARPGHRSPLLPLR